MTKLSYIDISPEISEKTAVYPGDREFSRNITVRFSNGNNFELSDVSMSLHIGAHTDAPNHYKKDSSGIDKRDLNYYFGPCQVVWVKAKRGERITVQHLGKTKITQTRVLLRTDSFPDANKWNADFNSFSPELIEYLATQKVKLVGIDTPSIDPADSKPLESHQAVAKNDMAVLEGINLNKVSPGEYFLSALPLNLKDCDASPVRAVLFNLDEIRGAEYLR